MSIFKDDFDFKRDGLIPAAIIVASVIVAGSIMVSANKIVKVFGNPGSVVAQGDIGAQDNGVKTDVSSRRDAPTIGKGDVEIIEFSDFQCPFCKQFFTSAYKDIIAKYVDTGKVKLVYRHYPLPFHQNAQIAAEAAECANRQGKFKTYHDILFTNSNSDGTGLSSTDLKKYAANLGLDTAKFNSCLDNGETKDVVAKDMKAAQDAGVTGTPTFFINGVKVVGALPFSEFQKVIEQELN